MTAPLRFGLCLAASLLASHSNQIDIPPRAQWPNGHGYCGETSIQSIALHYGSWISQKVVRKVAGGEVLLGVNESKTLERLHFGFKNWNSNEPKPQFEAFSVWLKSHLRQGHPAIFAVYLADGTDDPDYDHIVPAVGIEYESASSYDPADTLWFHSNFGHRLHRTMGTLSATRKKCTYDSSAGGCIPRDVDYGTAVTGIVDERSATLPVRLSVDRSDEPNVSKGEAPVQLHATVTASGLVSGRRYALLRYDDYKDVPTDATAAGFLSSNHAARIDFTATAAEWSHADKFMSDGVAYYRCVPL
ncbi:C39 family peptidase [Pendulispora brunnea]|uniref:C39 family peptidase n=1 Tax=Pendulispora brunnea TaxID=2905690 RepID=A0ABZ2KRK4_9BACT